MLRLEQHLRYADEQGVLADVMQFLRELSTEEWAYVGQDGGR